MHRLPGASGCSGLMLLVKSMKFTALNVRWEAIGRAIVGAGQFGTPGAAGDGPCNQKHRARAKALRYAVSGSTPDQTRSDAGGRYERKPVT